jgi:two-component system, OmpR family, phosphate regulon sensor histidine kinase PhoR
MGAESFARGDLAQRLPVPSTRETAGLAEAMNVMASRLENRIEAEINQRNQMEAILASMTEGVIAMDLDEHILSFNQAAVHIIKGLSETSKGQGLAIVKHIVKARGGHVTVASERGKGSTFSIHLPLS